MKIGAYQFGVSGMIQKNLERIKAAIVRASQEEVRLLVFPECALTGYPPRNIPSSADVDFSTLDAAHKELQTLANDYGIYLIVGTMRKESWGYPIPP